MVDSDVHPGDAISVYSRNHWPRVKALSSPTLEGGGWCRDPSPESSCGVAARETAAFLGASGEGERLGGQCRGAMHALRFPRRVPETHWGGGRQGRGRLGEEGDMGMKDLGTHRDQAGPGRPGGPFTDASTLFHQPQGGPGSGRRHGGRSGGLSAHCGPRERERGSRAPVRRGGEGLQPGPPPSPPPNKTSWGAHHPGLRPGVAGAVPSPSPCRPPASHRSGGGHAGTGHYLLLCAWGGGAGSCPHRGYHMPRPHRWGKNGWGG